MLKPSAESYMVPLQLSVAETGKFAGSIDLLKVMIGNNKMNRYDIFLSVVYVLNDNLDQLHKVLTNTVKTKTVRLLKTYIYITYSLEYCYYFKNTMEYFWNFTPI